MPRSLPNIERSQLRRDEYVGYANGAWRITRQRGGYWQAVSPNGRTFLSARTLIKLGRALERIEVRF